MMFKLIVVLTMFSRNGASISQQDYGNFTKEECVQIGTDTAKDFIDRFGRSASDSYYHCIPQTKHKPDNQ